MKHEKFKLFMAKADDLISDLKLWDFLHSGILPRSVSVHYDGDNTTACVGYDDEGGVAEGYHLVKVNMPGGASEKQSSLENMLSSAAAQLQGVICQDVLFTGDDVTVIFLTAK